MNYLNKIFWFLLILVCSCTDKKENKQTKFYYCVLYKKGDTTKDLYAKSLNYKDYRWHHLNDSIILSRYFQFKNIKHEIRLYVNQTNIDGPSLSYELDSIGIIFSRALYHESYIQLFCNNDSIAEIITGAMSCIIIEPELYLEAEKYYKIRRKCN